MDYLYVCHFSNGHIKVGRSIDPQSRIASHADRVACMGVELIEHHLAECLGSSAGPEAMLIERCASMATKRNKSEWFEGLDYPDVCGWADACAAGICDTPMNQIKAIRDRLGITQSALADGIGCTQGNVGHYEKGQTVPPDMAKKLIEFCAKSGLVIGYADIYGPVKTAKGAPRIPAKVA